MDIAILKGRATRQGLQEIRIDFTGDQLAALKDDLARIELARDDEDERFAALRTAYNTERKRLKDLAREKKYAIRKRYVDEERMCLYVPDYDAGRMEVYEEATGLLVESRRLRPEERQTTML